MSESRPVSPLPIHQSALPSLSQIESESGNEIENETSAIPSANENENEVSINVESNPGSLPLVVMPATPSTPAIVADPQPLDRADSVPPAPAPGLAPAEAPLMEAPHVSDGGDSAGISEMKSTLQNLQVRKKTFISTHPR